MSSQRELKLGAFLPAAGHHVAAWRHPSARADGGVNLKHYVQLAQTAVEAMPDVPAATDTLGWVYYKKRQPDLAISALTRSVEREPRNPVYRYHLGLAYRLAGDNDRARSALERALELKPDFAGAADARQQLAQLASAPPAVR